MKYVARANTVEATVVHLGGQVLMAALLDGAPMLVQAEAFEALYAEAEEEEAPKPVPVHRAAFKRVAAQKKTPAAGGMGTTAVLIKLCRETPSTVAELQDRLCLATGRDEKDKDMRNWAYGAIWAAINNKKLVKKTDPVTQLTRVHAVDGAK